MEDGSTDFPSSSEYWGEMVQKERRGRKLRMRLWALALEGDDVRASGHVTRKEVHGASGGTCVFKELLLLVSLLSLVSVKTFQCPHTSCA